MNDNTISMSVSGEEREFMAGEIAPGHFRSEAEAGFASVAL